MWTMVGGRTSEWLALIGAYRGAVEECTECGLARMDWALKYWILICLSVCLYFWH